MAKSVLRLVCSIGPCLAKVLFGLIAIRHLRRRFLYCQGLLLPVQLLRYALLEAWQDGV